MCWALIRRSDRALQVPGVPQDNRGDEQVEAGRPVLLVLIGAVADFAEAMDEHCARQAVAGLALVEFLAGRAPQFGVVNPVQREQRALQAAEFSYGGSLASRSACSRHLT